MGSGLVQALEVLEGVEGVSVSQKNLFRGIPTFLPAMNATQQMAAFRPQMLSYAARQLGDDELAEDVVQDAFVAAFDRADAFRGEAALKTWVFAILKNKIADALRGRYRRQCFCCVSHTLSLF